MAESPKHSTQKKITSFTSESPRGHESTNKSPKKKSKKKHQSSSESEAVSGKEESGRENLSQNGNIATVSAAPSPSASLSAPWTFEEENMLFERVEAYLKEKESCEKTKKPFYLKSIEWEKIPLCGEHTPEQAHARFMTLSNRVRKMRTAMEILEAMKQHHTPTPTPSRKRKREVDSELPRKPLTAYFQFVMIKRKKMAEKHPELSNLELTRKLSRRWNSLSDEKKQRYVEKYKKAKDEYQHQMVDYYQSHHDPDVTPPLSAYELWAENETKAIKDNKPDISDKKLKKKLNHRWENLSDDDKEEWFSKENSQLKRFEMAERKRKSSTK